MGGGSDDGPACLAQLVINYANNDDQAIEELNALVDRGDLCRLEDGSSGHEVTCDRCWASIFSGETPGALKDRSEILPPCELFAAVTGDWPGLKKVIDFALISENSERHRKP